MSYTPRQLFAFAELEAKRKAAETASLITAVRVAHHGEKADVDKALKTLGGGR